MEKGARLVGDENKKERKKEKQVRKSLLRTTAFQLGGFADASKLSSTLTRSDFIIRADVTAHYRSLCLYNYRYTGKRSALRSRISMRPSWSFDRARARVTREFKVMYICRLVSEGERKRKEERQKSLASFSPSTRALAVTAVSRKPSEPISSG